MAGAIARPKFDKSKMDEYTLNLLPKLNAKLVQGDNELLSFMTEFEVKGYQSWALQIIPDVTVGPVSFVVHHTNFFKNILKADNA